MVSNKERAKGIFKCVSCQRGDVLGVFPNRVMDGRGPQRAQAPAGPARSSADLETASLVRIIEAASSLLIPMFATGAWYL